MLARLGLSGFFTMNVIAFTMALWTTDVYGPGEAPSAMSATLAGLFRYVVLLFSLPVLAMLGVPPVRACLVQPPPGHPVDRLAAGLGRRRVVRRLVPLGDPGRGPDLLRGRLRDPGDDGPGPLARGDRSASRPARRSIAWRSSCPTRSGDSRTGRRRSSPASRSGSATRSASWPASASRPMAGSSATPAWWTSRSSPARVDRSSRSRATGSSGARSTSTATSPSA